MSTEEQLRVALNTSAPWIAGILNCTPDSFSDGGKFTSCEQAIEFANSELKSAHILDVGGEATGPGSRPISAEEELGRILPIVAALAEKRFISVDTYRASTADACLRAGAKMVNDVSGLRGDRDLAAVVKAHGAFLVMMYSKESGTQVHVTEQDKRYSDPIDEIKSALTERVNFAVSAGVEEDKLLLDPGMGAFIGHHPDLSWAVLKNLDALVHCFAPIPIYLGTSRKGFLKSIVNSISPQERDPLSQLTALIAVQKGAKVIRTHNPRMAADFLAAWDKTNY